MSDEHHEWRLGGELPIVRAHSVAKHRVIEQYLRRYVEVLTADLRIPRLRLTLIDGFAGGGLYRHHGTNEVWYGSPLLMIRAMEDAQRFAQAKRSKDFKLDVEFVFIEKKSETFDCLRANIQGSEFCPRLADRIAFVKDDFTSQVQSIISRVQARKLGCRAIFLLDQCGYKDVPFSAIQFILSELENAEVILTFATDSLIDYLSGQDSMQKTLEKLGLELRKECIQEARQQRDWRRAIQFLLHQQIKCKSGANYYTPFFIRSKDAHRDYWLIHLSNHPRARDVMVELHWLEKTSFAHFGRPGLVMLGYDQDDDIRIAGEQLPLAEFRFDEQAHRATHECLMEELPARLFTFTDGITYEQLFSRLTNETPATSEIIKAALAVMLAGGEIDIRDATGLVKRTAGIQHSTDVIKPSGQRLLFT